MKLVFDAVKFYSLLDGLRAVDIANKLGISRAAVSQRFRQDGFLYQRTLHKKLTLEQFQSLCELMEVSPDTFWQMLTAD